MSSLLMDTCIFARYHCTCSSLSRCIATQCDMTAVSINTSISMQHFSSNTIEAHMGGISIVTQLVVFSSLSRREFYRTGLCLLYIYKINFKMLQSVGSSFMCPYG